MLLLILYYDETNIYFIAVVLIGVTLVCVNFYLSTFISKQYFSLKTQNPLYYSSLSSFKIFSRDNIYNEPSW